MTRIPEVRYIDVTTLVEILGRTLDEPPAAPPKAEDTRADGATDDGTADAA